MTGHDEFKKSEKKYREIADKSLDGIIRTTIKDGRIISVNPAYCKLSEYDAENLIGESVIELGIILNNEQRRSAVAHLEKYGGLHDFEFNIRTKSGKVWAMGGTVRAIYDDDGSAIELEGIVRNNLYP